VGRAQRCVGSLESRGLFLQSQSRLCLSVYLSVSLSLSVWICLIYVFLYSALEVADRWFLEQGFPLHLELPVSASQPTKPRGLPVSVGVTTTARFVCGC
jgi:hypothetical protein